MWCVMEIFLLDLNFSAETEGAAGEAHARLHIDARRYCYNERISVE
jgi:hypothetical protein